MDSQPGLAEVGRVSAPTDRDGPVLITGGAGFIGATLADRLLSEGREVIVLDRFASHGSDANARWLVERHRARVRIRHADVRDRHAIPELLEGAAAVFHLAAREVNEPRIDFEVNAAGTLNVLEAMRGLRDSPPLIYTSTHKVYGCIENVVLEAAGERYQPKLPSLRDRGIDELQPLDFRTPSGCSKGTADQYVLEYARSFGLHAIVFRLGCIYGPRQLGNEEHGWVAHFAFCALRNLPVTIYGDGMQVRDLLCVDDLVNAFLHAWSHAPHLAGRAFNIGGGPRNAASLRELASMLAELEGHPLELHFVAWQPGDCRYYVSDTSRFQKEAPWTPQVGVPEGVARLREWLREAIAAGPVLAPAAAPSNRISV